jgi:acyl carrier protein
MWQLTELGEAAQRIRDHSEVREIAAVRSPDGRLHVLVEQQGFAFGTVLRDIVLDELGTTEPDVVVAVVRSIPRVGDADMVDPVASATLAHRVVSEGRWTFSLEPAETEQEMAIAGLLTEMLTLRRLSMTDSLTQIGVDSMVLVELSAAISERFGVTATAMDLFDVDTVRDLVHLVFGTEVAVQV